MSDFSYFVEADLQWSGMDRTQFARAGGKARARALSKEERREAARRAVNARWEKVRAAQKKANKNGKRL